MSGWGDLLKGKFKEVIDKSTGEKIMVDVNSREYDLDDSGNIVGGLPDDGAAPASKGPAPTGFVFGGAPASGAAPTFSFGVPPAGGGGSGGFSFGVPAPSTTPAFGAPPVFGAPQPSASIFGGFGSAGAAAPERRKRKASNQLGKAVGDVYVAGNGDCSQMGLGEDEGRMECAIPERLPALSKQGVLTIACGGMHTVALTEGGVLWSWGCNDDCALGRDGEEAWPAVVAGALRGERVVAVTAGDCHSVALVADGRVFSWGTYKDSNGYIGYAPQPHGGKREKADAPALVPGLDGVCITSIASGSNHTLAAVRGEPWVFAWGCGEQGQLGREVSKETRVAHLVPARPALTVGARAGDDGVRPACNGGPAEKRAGVPSLRVLNANLVTYVGALARTDPAGDWSDVMDEYIAYKRDLPAPAIGAGSFAPPGGASAPVPIAEVFCGSYHSFALGTDGSVHAFGLNNMGQLGLGQADKAPRLEPTRVRALDGKGVCALSGGEHHSIALTGAGDVYVFGRGDSSQLGLGDKCELHAAPQLLPSVSGRGVIHVCCGSNQCAAVTDTGDLYTWGFGEMYQLCNGKMQDNVTPQLVATPPLGDLRVLDASMGGQHTVVLAKADD